MITAIYKIENLVNSDFYIGSAKNLNKRFYEHRRQLNKNCHPNRYLQFVWNKYSECNFKFSIVELVFDFSLLIGREQFYIDNLKPKYNLAPTANSMLGFSHSEKTKAKISEAAKNISDETRIKMKTHKFSLEHRKNLSIARKKRVTLDSTKLKLSKAGLNRKHTKDAKLKQSKSKLGHIVSKETREKISKSLLERNKPNIKKPIIIH